MLNKFSFVGIAAMLLTSVVIAHPRRAICAGGANYPFYAYDSTDTANECARHAANRSVQCARNVRVGECDTDSVYVDTTYPENCECPTKTPIVGTWR